jgi:hypothetical protein
LHWYPCHSQASLQGDPHPVVFLILTYFHTPDAFLKKNDSVLFNTCKAYGLKNLYERGDSPFAEAEKVNVACGAVRRVAPQGKEHGPLENELFTELGATQTVKESFQYETGKDKLEILTLSFGHVKEALSHGSGNIRQILSGHESASR